MFLLWALWLVYFGSQSGDLGVTLEFLLLYGGVAGAWLIIGKRLQPTNSLLIVLRIERWLASPGRMVTREFDSHLSTPSGPPHYFFDKEELTGIFVRWVRVFVAVLGLAAWITLSLSPMLTGDAVVDTAIWSIVVFLLLPFLIFPIWVYNDSGLRHYNLEKGVVSVPGSTIRDVITGAGVALTVVSLVLSAPDFSEFLSLVVLLSAPSLLAAVIFDYEVEPYLVAKFRQSGIVKGIPSGTVSVTRG